MDDKERNIIIRVENLCGYFPEKSEKFINFTPADFVIYKGDFVVITGESGSGKTLLTKVLCGYNQHYSGKVKVIFDKNNSYELKDQIEYLKTYIGYVPQQNNLYDDLSLEKMLKYYAVISQKKNSIIDIKMEINKVLNDTNLTDLRKKKVGKLSGGEKKRASIAMELLSNPQILFLDEPDSGLDENNVKNIINIILKLTQRGITVICVTHNYIIKESFNLNLAVNEKSIVANTGTYPPKKPANDNEENAIINEQIPVPIISIAELMTDMDLNIVHTLKQKYNISIICPKTMSQLNIFEFQNEQIQKINKKQQSI